MIIDPHNDISVAVQISRNFEDYENYGESRIFRSSRMMVDAMISQRPFFERRAQIKYALLYSDDNSSA